MPGYGPSALGAATQVRIGEPDREMSVYSVWTINCLFVGNSDGVARVSQLLINTTGAEAPRRFKGFPGGVRRKPGGVAAILKAGPRRRPAAAACMQKREHEIQKLDVGRHSGIISCASDSLVLVRTNTQGEST